MDGAENGTEGRLALDVVHPDPVDAARLARLVAEAAPHAAVRVRPSARAAHETAAGDPPDLVLLCATPGGAAAEVAVWKEDAATLAIPVLVFSSDPTDAGPAYAARANAFVPTPRGEEAWRDALARLVAFWTRTNMFVPRGYRPRT